MTKRYKIPQIEPSAPVVDCIDVVKNYSTDDGDPVPAVRGISFAINCADVIAITGSSGSGKSTLLYCMSGLVPIDSGRVLIKGVDIHALEEPEKTVFRRRNIGFVFQALNLIPTLSGLENILLPSNVDGVRHDPLRLDYLVKRLGIGNVVERRAGSMSGGQQQRVAIARAMLTEPAVIFADEPTGSLDSANRDEVLALLSLAAKDLHQTVVIVTHDNAVAQSASSAIRVKDGLIEASTKD